MQDAERPRDAERPDGKQARLQLEDMLTRIELHFQVHSLLPKVFSLSIPLSSPCAFGGLILVNCPVIRPDKVICALGCLQGEMDLQAEKSARMEAEARCAAALEALRRAGHPQSMPLLPPAPRQLPGSVIDRAREGITAACSLVASVSGILEGRDPISQCCIGHQWQCQ